MTAPLHVVVDISGHGFGHLAQIAPVLQCLRKSVPDLKLTVRSLIDDDPVASFLDMPFERAAPPPDVGMEMLDPIAVDRQATAGAYSVLHAGWDQVVQWEAKALGDLAPDLLLSDVTYASLPGARRLGIPAIALSSLHWDGIYRAFCGNDPDAERILAEIGEAYRMADLFLQATPHMPMTDLPNRHPIGPLARLGTPRRERLLRNGETRLVMATFGGIKGAPMLGSLPVISGLRWIMPSGWPGERADATPADETGLPFIDLLASSDAVVTKVGYGTMVEAACNGTRVLYADRPDWPETPHLADWLSRHGTAQAVPRRVIETGDVEGPLRVLLERPLKELPEPTGAEEAVARILRLVGRN